MDAVDNRLRWTRSTAASSAVIGAALAAATPLAHADEDPAANPPNCSAADLEGVRAGVQASTSVYLFTHPDVNDFFDGLESLPRTQTTAKTKDYMTTHPQAAGELTAIRQPLVDLKDRCGQG